MKTIKFTVIYKGENPPTTEQIMGALISGDIDESGMLKVTKVNKKQKSNGNKK